MENFDISLDHAHFGNVPSQYGPQHALKVRGGLVQPAGKVTNKQADHSKLPPLLCIMRTIPIVYFYLRRSRQVYVSLTLLGDIWLLAYSLRQNLLIASAKSCL